jgi:hypothetical protein
MLGLKIQELIVLVFPLNFFSYKENIFIFLSFDPVTIQFESCEKLTELTLSL